MYYTRGTMGFTLIELLVVIAIIGLIASGAMASFGLVQRKGRDSRRMSDVQAIAKALASFVITSGGTFPISTTPVTLTGNDPFSAMLIQSGSIDAVPHDPGSPNFDYTYVSDAQGSTYTISFCLETDSVKSYVQGCGNTITP
ncbi:type II secretion system protein [Candidatus Kaiserbacteria bacterium]|nr:type II secretion system protein [Candidatus Kaiserbacteria bacterium]